MFLECIHKIHAMCRVHSFSTDQGAGSILPCGGSTEGSTMACPRTTNAGWLAMPPTQTVKQNSPMQSSDCYPWNTNWSYGSSQGETQLPRPFTQTDRPYPQMGVRIAGVLNLVKLPSTTVPERIQLVYLSKRHTEQPFHHYMKGWWGANRSTPTSSYYPNELAATSWP